MTTEILELSTAFVEDLFVMKQVTVQLSELISNFTASQSDYILSIDELSEMEDATEYFIVDLRNLLIRKRGQTATTLRRLFSEGFTMMMVPPEHFDVLETASKRDEDFCIVVKDGKDTICILCKHEAVW